MKLLIGVIIGTFIGIIISALLNKKGKKNIAVDEASEVLPQVVYKRLPDRPDLRDVLALENDYFVALLSLYIDKQLGSDANKIVKIDVGEHFQLPCKSGANQTIKFNLIDRDGNVFPASATKSEVIHNYGRLRLSPFFANEWRAFGEVSIKGAVKNFLTENFDRLKALYEDAKKNNKVSFTFSFKDGVEQFRGTDNEALFVAELKERLEKDNYYVLPCSEPDSFILNCQDK